MNFIAEVAQLVEQRFCKPQVVGSSPSFGSIKQITLKSDYQILFSGEIPKRSNGADCKSVGFRLRRFESSSPHHMRRMEWWNDGIMDWWNDGIMDRWINGLHNSALWAPLLYKDGN